MKPPIPAQPAPIAVALDVESLDAACELAAAVSPHVSHLKIGLETYLRDGAAGVERIMGAAASSTRLFLDLKLHDIPNTVRGATESVRRLEPDILTVHAGGGKDMVAAAVEAFGMGRIAAVTVLTSLSATDVAALGWSGTPAELAVRWAELAVAGGARALVCSPHEVASLRQAVGPEPWLITPGVRLPGANHHDQQRVATPAEAIANGASLLVIGRPITAADDPAAAAAAIAEHVRGA